MRAIVITLIILLVIVLIGIAVSVILKRREQYTSSHLIGTSFTTLDHKPLLTNTQTPSPQTQIAPTQVVGKSFTQFS